MRMIQQRRDGTKGARAFLLGALVIATAASPRGARAADPLGRTLSPREAQFWADAYALTAAELALGGVAVRNTNNDAIRRLAHTVWIDGNRATAVLNAVAHREKLATPRDVPPPWRTEIERLIALRGAAFDQAFLEFLRTREGQVLPEFADEADHGATEALRQYANAELSVLRSHAEAARRTPAR